MNFLEGHGAVRACRMGNVNESLGVHRRALQLMNQGRVSAGFRKLDSIGAVREGDVRKMAKAYATLANRKESVLAVVPTRSEKVKADHAIRSELIRAGRVRGTGRSMQTLKAVVLGEEERKQAASYTRGMIIEFQRNTFGFKAGSRWKVFGHDPLGRVMARSIGAARRRGDPLLRMPTAPVIEAMPLKRCASFAVFEPAKVQVSAGDTIRITKSAKARGHGRHGKTAPIDWIRGVRDREARAGSLHTVKRVTLTGALVLENGLKLTRDFQHFEHGYAVTSATASVPKVNHVLLDASNEKGFHIAHTIADWCARAKDSFAIYTRDKATTVEELSSADAGDSAAVRRSVRARERVAEKEKHWREIMNDQTPRTVARHDDKSRERERER